MLKDTKENDEEDALPSSSQPTPAATVLHIANEEPPSAISHPPLVPIAQPFIVGPNGRIKQCVKVLCGNVGTLADNSITLAIGQQGVDEITSCAMDLLDAGFMELLRRPQTALAEVAGRFLKPLERGSDPVSVDSFPARIAMWGCRGNGSATRTGDECVAEVISYVSGLIPNGAGTIVWWGFLFAFSYWNISLNANAEAGSQDEGGLGGRASFYIALNVSTFVHEFVH